MAMSGGKDDGAPMLEMNMTPLIDVLLVLLIMFIITIPVATHSVDIDLPQPNPNPPPEDQIDPIQNKIVLTQTDEILWNGDVIGQDELVRNLNLTREIVPEPELQFEPEALASYELSARVLNVIKASGVTKFGFVGNERYRTFGAGGVVAQ
ncbi:biopolymer transporter ExbD [Qipengyuania sp. DY56-A-20]|jgi:biopolymer transport protein ExbD|uniref:Biopolymer transporter ExbD n=1 Tax=Qipengyuania benthica TaxID=3067651 RepID=A0ABT9HBF8_9SPHN|nr:biopolymer transporter ExbD [Qipengyuania sp. DY56-A-20]MBU1253430.1 biopolymer transporter ExbD [Alphaproteobacteria bacterium]MBU1607712.1 biopolymer transporter ExbD [Alphaproteobacteria bacterium]MDP4540645.1 biopolymer transporter ExbD [Qipengyuania sp. DY56-A-20]